MVKQAVPSSDLLKDTYVIGVTGPSGSGKSLFTSSLCENLPPIFSIIREDNYYKTFSHLSFDERKLLNFDHVDSLDHTLLISHIEALKAGKDIEGPLYDHTNHCPKKERTQILSQPLLIIEGILVLADPYIRELLDLRIFIDTPLDICLSRRIKRDILERGRDIESIIQQYERYVRPMYLKFIEPTKRYADLLVPGGGANKIALKIIYESLRHTKPRTAQKVAS